MAEQAKRGKLAYKLLFWFMLVSLAPIGVVGMTLINVSQSALVKQALQSQASLASGFANTVWDYVNNYKNILLEAAHAEDFMAPGAGGKEERLRRQEEAMNRVMQLHAGILEVSIFDATGQEIMRKTRFGGGQPMRKLTDEAPFLGALQKGEFVGSLERLQGLYPAITVGVSIMDPRGQPPTPVGVLLGKISLNGLSQMLTQEFPDGGSAEAAVVSPDGFLVAHSRPRDIFKPDPKLPKEVTDVILTQPTESGSTPIPLANGEFVLGAYSRVKDYWWIVYVQQPHKAVYAAVEDMKRQILNVLLSVAGVTFLLSLALASHITQPVRLLNEAADRLSKGQFEDMPELASTNDEIGDLGQTFVQMADALRDKTDELLHAKQALEKSNRDLDHRVNVRTRELKAAQDELIKKERLAAIGQMASVVGHEIRNPLAVINNSIYFIKTKLGMEPGGVEARIAKHISHIESEIKQANNIIDEILSFSRSRALNPVPVAVNNFLEEILAVHPFPSHIQIVREFDPRNPVVNIDTDEMRQALRNVIGNGVEVMPEGGALKLRTEVFEQGWVRIEVSDTGPGIPPETLEKIFAPFFTTKARGTGLGLAVVRKVVDRHQGKVDVESAVGKGTTFKIYLPLAAKTPQPLVERGAKPQTAVTRLGPGPGTAA